MSDTLPGLDNHEEFTRERRHALAALDPAMYRAYMDKWNPDIAGSLGRMDDKQILHIIHLARLQARFLSEDDRTTSADWLKEHGYRGWEGVL